MTVIPNPNRVLERIKEKERKRKGKSKRPLVLSRLKAKGFIDSELLKKWKKYSLNIAIGSMS